jgi:hypothetical protein
MGAGARAEPLTVRPLGVVLAIGPCERLRLAGGNEPRTSELREEASRRASSWDAP